MRSLLALCGVLVFAFAAGCVKAPIAPTTAEASKAPAEAPASDQPAATPDGKPAGAAEQPGPKGSASFTVVQDPTATATWSPPAAELR